jgi:hypothetical protein
MVVAPDRVQDLAPRQHLAGVAHQVSEQLELAGRQLHVHARPLDGPARQVQRQVADLEDVCGSLVRLSELRPHPCEQFVDREWLDHVVVRAAVETGDLLVDLGFRGEHDHRRVAVPCAQCIEHVEATSAREHDVEQYQPVVAVKRLARAGITVSHSRHRVAGGLQAALNEVGDVRLVLHDQDAHATDPRSARSDGLNLRKV